MPNHVKNVIAVMGDKETVKRLIAELQNKEDGCLWYDLDYLVKKWNEFALEDIA